jgi:polyhydroxyalkanoate synthesis regulator phasin
MDSARPPFDALLNQARQTLESLSSRFGAEGSPAASLLDRLQLVPRSEIDRLRQEISALTARVAELESRLERLTPKSSS